MPLRLFPNLVLDPSFFHTLFQGFKEYGVGIKELALAPKIAEALGLKVMLEYQENMGHIV